MQAPLAQLKYRKGFEKVPYILNLKKNQGNHRKY